MNMFFSGLKNQLLTYQEAMDTYGVDPVNDPERAKAISLFPVDLTEKEVASVRTARRKK